MCARPGDEASVLVDASNLHSGGGVQVASSFIEELARLQRLQEFQQRFPWLTNVVIEVSREVGANLPSEVMPARVREVAPKSNIKRLIGRDTKDSGYDVAFTVFGPAYGKPRARRSIVGCADVVSFYGSTHLERPLDRLKMGLRGYLVRASFTRADLLVVETEVMEARVLRRLGLSADRVAVVSNTTHSIFDDRARWKRPILKLGDRVSSELRFAYVTRAYPHKNLDFLGEVHEPLQKLLGKAVKWVVTLNNHEWAARTDKFRESSVNLGPVPIDSVPPLYEQCDGLIFPSLLESFSASPLEAMKMGIPVFASDRDFIRATCGDAVSYFDPLDPVQAALSISTALTDSGGLKEKAARGIELLRALPSAHDRALRYIQSIDDLLPNSHVSEHR